MRASWCGRLDLSRRIQHGPRRTIRLRAKLTASRTGRTSQILYFVALSLRRQDTKHCSKWASVSWLISGTSRGKYPLRAKRLRRSGSSSSAYPGVEATSRQPFRWCNFSTWSVPIPNAKIFVHCKRGADRTGVMVAAYRIVVQHKASDRCGGRDAPISLRSLLAASAGALRAVAPTTLERRPAVCGIFCSESQLQ